MKKQKKLIVGNWKMFPDSLREAKKIGVAVKRGVRGVKSTQVVICPPYVYLSPLSTLSSNNFGIGAQDTDFRPSGAFTGQVSFMMLPEFKVGFVILGHSERRKMGETDDLVNKKTISVVNEGMTAIVCVGESVRDSHGDYFGFIKNQIVSSLKDVSKKLLNHVVIAYEPIWAIGAREAMSPRDLHEMSIFIMKVLKDQFGPFAQDVRILYGGSVDRVNADTLIKEGNVSGLLIGRQSLVSKDFVEIIKLVDAIK
jgi:triosephosphate isomerase